MIERYQNSDVNLDKITRKINEDKIYHFWSFYVLIIVLFYTKISL